MAHDYVVSCRRIVGDAFDASPGPVRFLRVPAQAKAALPEHAVSGASGLKQWVDEVVALADGDENPNSISPRGDILSFIHGYNNSPETILWRQRQLRKDLRAEGWRGLVIGFDWPCENQTLNYIEDRWDAASVAVEFVRKCVKLIAEGQSLGCETNIHLLGHSTGAYVIMEAFAQAQKDGELFKSPWRVGQVAFIGGDVSSASLSISENWAQPMFQRVMRLTNYSNPYDSVLAVSNAKRLGTAPRSGRSGLPADASPKAVNVDCGEYFRDLNPKKAVFAEGANFTHSWHIGDRVFARDLAMKLEGAIDRHAITTRRQTPTGLVLEDGARPRFNRSWNVKESLREPEINTPG